MTVRSDYLPSHLTPQQVEAITYRGGPLQIVAGPGSGKTEVIAWRVAHLLKSGAASPESVLVTTFTEKAALELKDRIQSKLSDISIADINVERMQVSTIHSLCHTLLEQYRHLTPFPHGMTIIGDAGQLLFVFTSRRQLRLNRLLKGRESDFYNEVIRTYNFATEEMVDTDRLLAWYEKQLARSPEDENALWEERCLIAQSYKKYLQLLRENESTDFANLQRHALDVLESHPEVRSEIQQRFTDVLVDEYQDTNAIQNRLLGHIAEGHGNLAVVGDDDQSIYRFRGATVKNILTFREAFPAARRVDLKHNFRSLMPIVAHSLRVIEKNSVARMDKELVVNRVHWKNDIILVHGRTAADEARGIAETLQRLKVSGIIEKYHDVAVLLRSVRSHAQAYIEAFRQLGIPHVVTGDAAFFEDEVVRQLYNLLVFLGASKPWGDKFVQEPVMNLSKATVKALKRIKDDLTSITSPEAFHEKGVNEKADIKRLMALLDLKRKVQAKKHASFEHVFHDLLRITGCFQPSQENPQKAKNVGTLSLIIADYDRYAPSRNIYPFLEYLKLLKTGGLPSGLPEIEDAVNITTVHQAKGLEFPVVVIGSVMEGRFPTHRRRAAYEIPHELTASRGPEIEDHHVVDERKLFYVAATRARDLLIIGTADVVNKRGGGPSRFIDEMLGTDLTQILERSRSALSRKLKVEAPGKPAAGVRPRLSYSQLSYFLQCPLRYKYFIIDGVQVPYVDVIGFGNNVHRILETIHKKAKNGDIVREEDLPLLVRESWLRTPVIDEERQAQAREAAVEQIGRYLELHAHTLHDVKDAELRFAFDFEGSLVSGRIDLVRRQPSGAVEIVDFKASESRREQYDQTELQLSFYSIGASEDLSLNVGKCTAYFLKDSVNWHFDWNDEKRQVTENVLRSTLESIRRGDFQPRREYCRYCDEFRNICPHYAR